MTILSSAWRPLVLLLLLLCRLAARAQGVGIGTTSPNPAAALDISSTSQGLLLPRLTATQRQLIASPTVGLTVYQTDGTPGLYTYTGVAWVSVSTGRAPDANGSTVPANGAVVSTLAGTGSRGNTNAAGTAAGFAYPRGVAVDAAGMVYVADAFNNLIRKITPAGVVTTLAGTGVIGNDNGPGIRAGFNMPTGIAVDGNGVVYVADQNNNMVRKITPAGVVTTLARGFNHPSGVAVDVNGTVYVADTGNNQIRKIDLAGAVSTLAGSGTAGSVNDAGMAASFSAPTGVAVDVAGTVYVTDQGNHLIRKLTIAGAVVNTLAGTTGTTGSTNGTGTSATFNGPFNVAVDAGGTVYVADTSNHLIRVIR